MNIRKIEYISYSAFKLFETDPEGYYRKYLAINRPPRDPQNHFMAIGSAFDAFIKADLHKRFLNDGDPKYTKEALFEAQVEAPLRDRARVDGTTLYDRYKKVGAYADLCLDMEGCINPGFETTITAELSDTRLEGGIMLLGKPDIQYISKFGARVIHDFKCQGFYSKAPKSPSAGYIKLFTGGAGHMTMHKSAMPMKHKGFTINGNAPLHIHCPDWAEQLTMYAWSLGCSVGEDYILSIDQICSNSQNNTSRVAKHAAICNDDWQTKLFRRLHRCWQAINTGHVFLNLPFEESVARCEAIDAELVSKPDDTFKAMTATFRER